MRKAILGFGIAFLLSACVDRDRGLRDLRTNGGGPDEFSILPLGALEVPEDTSVLPRPTPGGGNLTDPRPVADAIAVLGGNPNALNAVGIPAADGALIAAAGRNGVDPTIRQTLAAEDERFRQRRSRWNPFAGRDRYFRAYSRQSLNASAELQRFRNAGVATPSAPPQ